MRVDGNQGSKLNYEPNRQGAFAAGERAVEPPLAVGAVADRFDHRADDDDYYSQPRALFQLFDEGQRQRLFGNIAAAMQGVPADIVQVQLAHFRKIDPASAQGVEQALNVR
jgi:catalase